MVKKRLGELLVMAGAIDELQLQSALGEQRKWGRHLGITLVEMGLLDEESLVGVLSKQLNIPAVKIDPAALPKVALTKLSHEFCLNNSCIPIGYEEKGSFLDVAMADPTNPEIFDRIRVETRCNLRPHLGGPRSIEQAVRELYLGQKPGTDRDFEDNRPWMVRPDEVVFDEAGSRDAATDPQPADGAGPPGASGDRRDVSSARRDELLANLHKTVQQLRANLERDEKVIKKLMSLLVEKHVCTRQELIAKIHEN